MTGAGGVISYEAVVDSHLLGSEKMVVETTAILLNPQDYL